MWDQQVVQVDQPQGWNPGATASDSFRALVQTLQVLGDLAIGFIVYLVPVLIILALPFVILFLIARWLWHRRKPRRTEPHRSGLRHGRSLHQA